VARAIDYGDIQGLVRFGYGGLKEACFFLVDVRNAAAARQWLASAPVTSAVAMDPPPERAVQIAFTWDGLRALGLPASFGEGFSPEFVSGMAGEESRSRRLGDVGTSTPGQWRWGGHGKVPHAVVLLYAKPEGLEDWKETTRSGAWAAAFQEILCLPTSDLDGIEPFGFRDGISQPALDWDGARKPAGDELEYGNLLALGEFLLGYPNEYGKYTLRPLLAEADDPRRLLPPARDDPGRRDLGGNGTYLVLRELEQDVSGFWRFLDAQASGDAQARRRLAESMVGRTMAGEPLVAAEDRRIAGVGASPEDERLNRFTYDADGEGLRCPAGAHIRRANPRNADFPAGSNGFLARLLRIAGFGGRGLRDDLVASSRFHRILRRGREYGPGLSPEDALRLEPSDGEPRGLHFLCLNANIARQFEFVQNAWMMGTKFAGLSDEGDPLMGSRHPIPGCLATDTFSVPREDQVSRRLTSIPRFVTVRGGAYFFLPSLSALRYLASLGA
jgi:deferrochelatase/peroxidase EfeB